MTTILLRGLDDLESVAQEVLKHTQNSNIICFKGTMGAGKTTLIRAICEQLGVSDVVTSPTFALVNEYTSIKGNPVYHFDFYRIKNIEEVFDLGYEDYFYNPDALCLIEWPELIENLLPESGVIWVNINVNSNGTRTIVIE